MLSVRCEIDTICSKVVTVSCKIVTVGSKRITKRWRREDRKWSLMGAASLLVVLARAIRQIKFLRIAVI